MYSVNVQHYDGKPQSIQTFEKKTDAMRFLNQQAEIVKGYRKRTGWIDEQFIVFGDGDIFLSRFWISKMG